MNTAGAKSFFVFSGGNDRAVIAFLRALRACGERASIIARTPKDRVLRTRYRTDVRWVREDHELDLIVFAEAVRRAREKVGDNLLVVLPSTEYFNQFLLRNREAIEMMGCEIPLVDASVYALLTGKRSATDFFSTAGVSVPLESTDPVTAELPLVAKPLRNIADDGRSLYPQIVTSREQLGALLGVEREKEYFFQEYVRGDSLYLLLYLPRDRSAPVMRWSQRNLLQQPGGKSMLFAEAADLHDSVVAERMISSLREAGFWGLGMIEVIRTRDDRAVFIEMNPRIWGPVQFCTDQQQPLLHAFIGEVLYGDPLRFVQAVRHASRLRDNYCWFGGFAETCASRGTPTAHPGMRTTTAFALASLRNDIYLRSDSWRCFLYELGQSLRKAAGREHIDG